MDLMVLMGPFQLEMFYDFMIMHPVQKQQRFSLTAEKLAYWIFTDSELEHVRGFFHILSLALLAQGQDFFA